MFKFILFLLVVVPQWVFAQSDNANPWLERGFSFSELQLKRFNGCGQDSDCTPAYNGCCLCSEMGAAVAVNRSLLEEFQKSFRCDGVVCRQEDGRPSCLDGLVSCVNGRCLYAPKSKWQIERKDNPLVETDFAGEEVDKTELPEALVPKTLVEEHPKSKSAPVFKYEKEPVEKIDEKLRKKSISDALKPRDPLEFPKTSTVE